MNLEDLLKQTGDTHGLSQGERERMRTLLTEYTAFKPVRVSARPFAAHLSPFVHPAFAALSAFVVVLAGTGGAAYAAEGALPGDLLYPVKISMTEPVVTALTPAGRAQVTWHITIAKRRLGEAAQLKAQGRLASSTEATLASEAADATLEGATLASALPRTSTTTNTGAASSTETLIRASTFLLEGRGQLKKHDDTAASQSFHASIRAASQLEALTQTTGAFELNDEEDPATTSLEQGQVEGTSTVATTTSEWGSTRREHEHTSEHSSTSVRVFDEGE